MKPRRNEEWRNVKVCDGCGKREGPKLFTDIDSDWDFLVNEIDGMWAEIDALRSALRHLNEWRPSQAPRQAEIDRLLEAPAMSKRSLLQLRARLEMSPTAAIMDQLVVDE